MSEILIMTKTLHVSRSTKAVLIGLITFCLSILAQADNPRIADEYIVKFKNHNIGDVQGQQKATFNGIGLVKKMGSDVTVLSSIEDVGFVHIKSKNVNKINELKHNPDVEFVEPNYVLSLSPDDGVSAQANPSGPTDTYNQNFAHVQVKESWGIAAGINQAQRTLVAVVDTGLYADQAVFKDSNSLWVNQAEKNGLPGVDDDGNGYIDDINGWNFNANNSNITDDNNHGTHVAGIVIGLGMNIVANPVQESRIKIMPLKFLDASGSGTTSKAVEAIIYAVRNGAKVINNSWGGPNYSRALHEAYTYANTNNVLVASAAGNDGKNLDANPLYPASLDTPNNIAVAATDQEDNLASFSNFSPYVLQVAAPGDSILSTVRPVSMVCNPGTYPGCFRYMSGTSMATPFVAGLAAMILREAPQLSPFQVKGILQGSAEVFSHLQFAVSSGNRVNAYRALIDARNNANTIAYSPSYSPAYKVDGRSIASESTSAAAGGCGLVKALANDNNTPQGPFGSSQALVLSLILLPLALVTFLKQKMAKSQTVQAPVGKDQRVHERFNLNQDIEVKINDQVYHLTTQTISLGGLSISGDLQVAKGEKIKIKIGSIETDLEAEVVWSSKAQQFGVKFNQVSDQILEQIRSLTKNLAPTPSF